MKSIRTHFHTRSRSASGGYSLIETVVYVALFVLLAAVLVGTLYGMDSAYRQIRANDDLLDSAELSMGRMMLEIRSATGIDTGASTFGTSPGVLTLNSLDASGAPKTVKFDLSSGALEVLDSTVGTPADLTGGQVEVTSLVFRDIATTATSSAVRVEATFTSLRAPATSVTETDTAVLRGSY